MTVMTSTRPLSGRTVFALLIAGFGAVLIANLTMVWLALDSWPGLISETAYQDGLDFNRVLEAGERQRGLEWQVSIAAPDGVVELVVSQADGVPVVGLTIFANAYRPAAEGSDSSLDLREVSPGHYRAVAPLHLDGNWNVVIDAVWAGEPYHIERRIFVVP
jgi:nitrogen fixation protein FixH